MTALLYISYSSELSEDDKLMIDRQISINREKVCIVVKTLASNAKYKTKKIIVVIILGGALYFSNVQASEAIGLSMPAAPVVRVQPSYQYDSKIQIAKVIPRKKDLIIYKSPKKILFLMYLNDPRISSNQEVLKLVKELRGGSWGLLGTAAFLGLIILIFSMGEGFVPNNLNPGWGLERPNPFQPPASDHKYPPYYGLFFPRKTCYADRPGGSQIMSGVNPQSSREELTQLSTNVVPTQTQMSGFVKNGKVDLDKCLNEVNRRASEIGCTDFGCSLERFKVLATENGKLTSGTAREAITILQGEMQGYYRNARREDYGLNVKGPDFLVEGLGEFENITHVEVKNPVGSAIKIAHGQKGIISKQGKKIGAKIVYQQNYWSNSTKTSELENINPTASLPQSPNNVLGAVDNFDVPSNEKAFMEGSVLNGSKNNTNIIFLNNN
uniref:hypothetical protein n=1 Tax=Nitzschia traheaformis TaxID=1881117 RepID=UPI001EFA0157|nr:hypothetical protein MKU15_pgp058 [Nitzschia traheaformis]ULD15897.1 hypothetical protein [Nitzschia traheaformis]